MSNPPRSSLGMGFEYRGTPPVPVITVIEPGGPADLAGVKVGDTIISVDDVEVAGIRTDVRELLVNDRPQVRLQLQSEGSLLSSGTWGFVGMGSLRVANPPRSIVITRRRDGVTNGGPSPTKAVPLDPSAQAAKDRGRRLFQEEQWEQAAQAFTEAMGRGPAQDPTLLTNRALCNQKLQRWDEVERDARAAMGLTETSVKAHYLLGKALLELGRLEEAKVALTKSMSLSSSKEFQSYRGSIELGLLLVRKRLWMREQAVVDTKDERTSAELLTAADRCRAAAQARGDDPAQVEALYQRRVQAIGQLSSRARCSRASSAFPDGVVCRLSHRIMIDPVCTPQGQTYERSAIEKHVAEKGPYDPFRKNDRVTKESLVPNLSLKKFIDDFLEEHPWAFED